MTGLGIMAGIVFFAGIWFLGKKLQALCCSSEQTNVVVAGADHTAVEVGPAVEQSQLFSAWVYRPM